MRNLCLTTNIDTTIFVVKTSLTYKRGYPILPSQESKFLSNDYNEDEAVSL
jgi:hypothetical protein